MKFALVNPNWDFAGSSYFGCQETHVPLELFCAAHHLQPAGHDTLILDAHLENLSPAEARARLRRFQPDFIVMPDAPTYLFWRCPQPELRIPALWWRELQELPATRVDIGPHASATPEATARKLPLHVLLRGEADETLPALAGMPWRKIPGCCFAADAGWHFTPTAAAADLRALGPLAWRDYPWPRRTHRHHVFTGPGRGAELEASRGCPWSCDFCNKTQFRNRFRERPLAALLADVDALLAAGISYIYFIDEIFGCGRSTPALLAALAERPLQFGMQTRIDLWDEAGLEALGRAGCISMECGIEDITPAGRDALHKGCRMTTARMGELLTCARRHIPWVQANLIAPDDAAAADLPLQQAWRGEMQAAGVWVSAAVPLFPFPGSPRYQQLFGEPDDTAWERAHEHYLRINHERGYSDIQAAHPLALPALEISLP